MARAVKRLSARTVEALKTPGRHADGAGLYLHIDPSMARRWVFVFQWQGKRKEMGLGPVSLVSLAEARDLAHDARKVRHNGENPIDVRNLARAMDECPTFGVFSEDWISHNESVWRNPKHRQQWKNTLKTYAASFADLKVRDITTDHVVSALRPIWTTKPETASRVRMRVERVLDAARVQGIRSGENPARWKGHLDAILPRTKKLSRGHHAALPFKDAAAFMVELRKRNSLSAKALEFTILTAARTSETLQAKWAEIDLKDAVWTVPGARMKAGREHRVPLTQEALKAIGEARNPQDWVFPGTKDRRSLSSMSLAMQLRRMERTDLTVHGFRSTFRDWAGETSSHPREVVEAALSHAVGDATERAYRRGDALEKRRALMSDWAKFLSAQDAESKNL